MSLRELLEDAAIGLPGATAEAGADGSLTWSRSGRAFAVLDAEGSSAEFGLDAAVADAAARTPDVTHSARGAGWVTFSPAYLDDHAADRAIAWLASSYRRTGPLD